jgi:hypothetical protein
VTIAGRTIKLVNDLLVGWVHDRESVSKSIGVELAAADRYMLELAQMQGVRVDRRGRKKYLSYRSPERAALDRWAVLKAIAVAGRATRKRKK